MHGVWARSLAKEIKFHILRNTAQKKLKKKKKLSDKKKLREFSTTKSIYDKCLKNFSRLKTQERKGPIKNKLKAIKKMLIET